jgi:glycerol-3-phosphate acyltransferase PlsY
MEALLPAALLLISYVIGSIPFSYLVAHVFARKDIRQHGSGNVGATNVMRNAGKMAGILALLLDIAKGYAAVALARYTVSAATWPYRYDLGADVLHSPSFWIGSAAVLAVLGHMYPVWLDFRGGKGVATAAGVFLALQPKALGAAIIIFLITLIVSRFVSLASMLAAASLPVFVRFLTDETIWITVAAVTIAVAVVVKHHANIARLARGEERRFPR